MNDGFIISLGKRRVALFSLFSFPEDLSHYSAQNADFFIIITPSQRYDFKVNAYGRRLGERVIEPDALCAVGVFFLKVRGLPLDEIEIEYNGAPVRIKTAILGDDKCVLELSECKLISTKCYVTESKAEVKLSTVAFYDRVFVRLMKCEVLKNVKRAALSEFNFIPNFVDTSSSCAYTANEGKLDLLCDESDLTSLLYAAAALDASRASASYGKKIRFSEECAISEAEIYNSGLIRLFYHFRVLPINSEEEYVVLQLL